MRKRILWAGIDTSTRSFAVCLVDQDGEVVRETKLPAVIEDTSKFLADPSEVAEVAFESGATSMHPARALQALGYNVAVYHAQSVQRFIRFKINKTDSNDARGLAEIARLKGGRLRKVFLRSATFSALRIKLVTRERIMRMRKVNEGALMSLLHSHGVRARTRISSETSLRRVVLSMIEEAEATYGEVVRDLAMPLVELSAHLRRFELKLEADLKAYAINDDLCQRLMEIPGIGLITTISFVTAIGDPTRFPRSSDAGPYFGLVPRIWETGTYTKKRRITKAGSAMTRRHLHMAASSALHLRHPTPLQNWAKEIAARTGRKTATVALARKLAVLMLAMWKNGSSFNIDRSLPREIRGEPADYVRITEVPT